MPILLALIAANAIQKKSSNPFGEMSRLGNMPGTLLSASYLYQGLPDDVFGLEFKYADSRNLRHEDYLEKLIDNEAVGSRRNLREDVIFLSNRLYVDKKYEKSYLLLGRAEARNRLTDLYYLDQSHFSHEDQLLLKTLQTFFCARGRPKGRNRHLAKDAEME